MVRPRGRVLSARFTQRPVNGDFSSTCGLPNIIYTQKAGIEFRRGIIQNIDIGITKHGLRARRQAGRALYPPIFPAVEYHYFSLEYHYFFLTSLPEKL